MSSTTKTDPQTPTVDDMAQEHLMRLVTKKLQEATMALSTYQQKPNITKAEEATRVAHETLGTIFSLQVEEKIRLRNATE